MSFQSFVFNHLKNIPGWKINKKLIVFAVDDYGNIRLHSKLARENLQKSGVRLLGRFDYFDALDTKEDYEMLFEVLDSVRDRNNRPANFTTYALSTNIDYSSSCLYNEFIPENLNDTYAKLAGDFKSYVNAYETLLKGIEDGFIKPQFHGREHLNVHLFNALIRDRNPSLHLNLEYKSLAGIPGHTLFPNIGFSEAFAFWSEDEIDLHKNIIKDGLERFEKVYGYPSKTFTPPAQQLNRDLYEFTTNLGIIGIDKVRSLLRHKGKGNYEREYNILGEIGPNNSRVIVRNCVFEPTEGNIDWVAFTFNQIKTAFYWGKPAIISSHRVNFCGQIEPENRKNGLLTLKKLLEKIVKTWPDAEFISMDQLAIDMYENC
jgi:hypothetical protein